jgi:hypothetical protein
MRVSPELMTDLKYLAWWYDWPQSVKDHVKAALREWPQEFSHYLSSLAAAHRAGYAETNGRGLTHFCATHKIPHPYVGELEDEID